MACRTNRTRHRLRNHRSYSHWDHRRLHLRDHIRLKQFYRLEPLDSCLYHCSSLLPEEGVSRPCQNPSSVSNVCAPTAAPSSTICTGTRLFVRNARVCSSRRRPPRSRRVGWRTDGPRPSRKRQCRSLSLSRSSRGRGRLESRRMKLYPSRRSTVQLSSRRRTTPTKTSAASSATARKTSRLDPYPVPLVSRNP